MNLRLLNTKDNILNLTKSNLYFIEGVIIMKVKERKDRRVSLLLKSSSVEILDEFARDHDTSRNDIIQQLIDNFIKNPNKLEILKL